MSLFLQFIFGIILLIGGFLLFLMEFKAFPHNPKNPQWWDDFHARNIRMIRVGGRMCLLLGLTFTFYSIKNMFS